jgi:hypothetical protein
MPGGVIMPVKCIRRAISKLCSEQNGSAIPDTAIILVGIVIITMIVVYCTSGIGNAGANPSTFKSGPGTFSPITELEANHNDNPERVYSVVKGAIADLDSRVSDNRSPSMPYDQK